MAPTPVDIKNTDRAEPSFAMWQTHLTEPEVWESFRTEVDRLIERFIGPGTRFRHRVSGTRTPTVDVSEDETAWRVEAELPGLAETDVEVVVAGDRLMLRGEKRQKHAEADTNFRVSERNYGSFSRSFTIPENVDRDAIAAKLANGVLMVTLPKRPGAESRERRIEIKADT